MHELELGAHGPQPIEMHVDGTRAEVVPAGKGDPGAATPRQERPEHEDRSPHSSHQIDGRLGEQVLGHLHLDRGADEAAAGSDVLDDVAHELHVEDRGNVVETMQTRGHERRHQLLENGVLRPEHGNLAVQPAAPGHNEIVHHPIVRASRATPPVAWARLTTLPVMRVAIAADHAGFRLKEHLSRAMAAAGHAVTDLGTHDETPVDYPDYAAAVGRTVVAGKAERGVVVCGSGAGAAIAANKVNGVRCAQAHDTYTAHQAVEHDDANVISLGARVIGPDLAAEILLTFLGAHFSNEERNARRVAKIRALEDRS